MLYSPARHGEVNYYHPLHLKACIVLILSGPGYCTNTVFDLTTMYPYTIEDILHSFRQITPNVALFLPRTSDLRQLARESHESKKLKVVHYCIEGASKVFLTRLLLL